MSIFKSDSKSSHLVRERITWLWKSHVRVNLHETQPLFEVFLKIPYGKKCRVGKTIWNHFPVLPLDFLGIMIHTVVVYGAIIPFVVHDCGPWSKVVHYEGNHGIIWGVNTVEMQLNTLSVPLHTNVSNMPFNLTCSVDNQRGYHQRTCHLRHCVPYGSILYGVCIYCMVQLRVGGKCGGVCWSERDRDFFLKGKAYGRGEDRWGTESMHSRKRYPFVVPSYQPVNRVAWPAVPQHRVTHWHYFTPNVLSRSVPVGYRLSLFPNNTHA